MIRMTPDRRPANSMPVVGKVPAEGASRGLAARNPAIANTKLFARIVKKLGRESLNEAAVRELSLRTRSEITAFLNKITPGPELKIEVQCPHCRGDMSYPFDLYGFFLPNG